MDWQKTYCNIILTYYCHYSVQQCCTMILATFLTESVTLGRGIKRWCCLTSVCLLHTSGLSREQRGLGRLKFAQTYPTSHMTRTPLSRSKGQRSGQGHQARPLCSLPCWRIRRLQRWAWERVGHGKLLLRCHLLSGARRFGTQGRRGEGAYHGGRQPTYSLFKMSAF